MERFNNIMSFICSLFILCLMAGGCYLLWQVDVLWGVAAIVVCLGLIWHWLQDGGIGNEYHYTDDTALPYDEKEKIKFWEFILQLILLPFRVLYHLFT